MGKTLQHFELHVLLAMLRERGETYSVPLVVALEKQYGMKIQSHEIDKSVFASVAHLADFVSRTLAREDRGEKVNG